jgi:monovalent cation:H+ antiporter-2, CPA2 family
LAVSFNEEAVAFKVLEIARGLGPAIPVLVRTKDDAHLEELMQAGATEVVPEALEGSQMIGAHMLLLLGTDADRVRTLVDQVRRDRYQVLRGFFHGRAPSAPAYRKRLHSVTLVPGARAVDNTLGDADLAALDVAVTTMRRRGREERSPSADTRLAPGDVLVLYGMPEALARAEEILLKG